MTPGAARVISEQREQRHCNVCREREELRALYRHTLSDFQHAVRTVDFRPSEILCIAIHHAMCFHGLTREGAASMLRYLKLDRPKS